LSNNVIAEIFSHKNKTSYNYIFDILIGNFRYISYPIWIDTNRYLKKAYKEEDDPNNSNDEETYKQLEKKKNTVRLKMFNIVLMFDKNSPILSNLEIVYQVLESFCKI
jgi:hypothetical protein